MARRVLTRTTTGILVAAMATTLAACGGSTGSTGTTSSTGAAGSTSASASSTTMPTVTLMVGGIDKQIYLPYQLAEGLGFYKKYGVNVELSTEQSGGVGAEDAMISGQVDMAGAWYVHTIDFQQKGKDVIDVVQLSGAPGEREMCATGTKITSPADWAGKTVGVTDLGSGTDDLTLYMAAKSGLTSKQFSRQGVGAGSTLVAALQQKTVVCGMTTQPTVSALETKGVAYSAIDLATTEGATKWLGGAFPSASVLAQKSWVDANKDTVQKVVDALVATMHYIATHSAADIADHLPADFVQNDLVSKADYIKALDQDKGQFLPDGMMPANGPATVLQIEKDAGKVTGTIDLSKTYTNDFAIAANKLEGFTK
jgi:NitT/TauT family transport system substrate-binding protein